MQLTQIQGASIGKKNIIPQGSNIPLPVPPQIQNIQAPGYIHETEGEKVLVPHADIPVAINNEMVVSPTPINHGDAITINHGAEDSETYMAHKPEEKIESNHVKSAAKKAGISLEDNQIQEIISMIEKRERKSLIAIIVIGLLGFIISGFVIFMLWSNITESTATLKNQQKALHQLQSELQDINQESNSDNDEFIIEELVEKITNIEAKLSIIEASSGSIDEQSKKSLEELITELKSLTDDNKKYSDFSEKLRNFESLLKASDLGIQAELNTYYQNLKDQCGADECCLNSFQVMLENSYKLSENGSCKNEEKLNRLKCIGSYEWCYVE